MQAVFSLIKYNGLRSFDYIVSDFFTTICRQAVHYDCFRSCCCQKFCVDLIRSEDFFASVVFFFLTHTCPSIGVKNVGTFNCFHYIFFNGNSATCMCSIFLSFSQNMRIRLVTFRASTNHVHTNFSTSIH